MWLGVARFSESEVEPITNLMMHIGKLQPYLAFTQCLVCFQGFLHQLIDDVLCLLEVSVKGVLLFCIVAETVNLPCQPEVPQLIEYPIYCKFVLISSHELPPSYLCHMCVLPCTSPHHDQEGADLMANAHGSTDICVVGGILDVPGNGDSWFNPQFPKLRVVDIDGVKMQPLAVIEDVPHWCYLIHFFFDASQIIDLIFHDGDGVMA